MSETTATSEHLPVIIVGAGIGGLILAQQLLRARIPYRVFERDTTLQTRGAGWGLTLHWSLPALRELLPNDIMARIPGTYVDTLAVERGESSRFPFFDLTTGELKGSSPAVTENQRIRVTRKKLRRLLADNIEIQWGKSFQSFRETATAVTAVFGDGTECQGRLIIGCDGSRSRVRQALLPAESANRPIPVRLFGFIVSLTADQAKPIRDLDPFFLQGTASASNKFMYISLLEAPISSQEYDTGKFVYQICISWNTSQAPNPDSSTNEKRINLIRDWSQAWAEPFRSFVSHVTDTTDIKQLDVDDFAPHADLHPEGKVLLVGDALHAMSMYRGEGANHVILDVLDFKNIVLPQLLSTSNDDLQARSNDLLNAVIHRTRPAVLASRQACLDAHDWQGLTPRSPLLTKRQMFLSFDE